MKSGWKAGWVKAAGVALLGLSLGVAVHMVFSFSKASAAGGEWLIFKEKPSKAEALKELAFKDKLMLPDTFPIPNATERYVTPNLDKKKDPKRTHLEMIWDDSGEHKDHITTFGTLTVTPLREGETVQFTPSNDQTVQTPWGSALLQENGAAYFLFLQKDGLLYQFSLNKEPLVKHLKEKDGLSDEVAKTKAKLVFLDFVKSMKKAQ